MGVGDLGERFGNIAAGPGKQWRSGEIRQEWKLPLSTLNQDFTMPSAAPVVAISARYATFLRRECKGGVFASSGSLVWSAALCAFDVWVRASSERFFASWVKGVRTRFGPTHPKQSAGLQIRARCATMASDPFTVGHVLDIWAYSISSPVAPGRARLVRSSAIPDRADHRCLGSKPARRAHRGGGLGQQRRLRCG